MKRKVMRSIAKTCTERAKQATTAADRQRDDGHGAKEEGITKKVATRLAGGSWVYLVWETEPRPEAGPRCETRGEWNVRAPTDVSGTNLVRSCCRDEVSGASHPGNGRRFKAEPRKDKSTGNSINIPLNPWPERRKEQRSSDSLLDPCSKKKEETFSGLPRVAIRGEPRKEVGPRRLRHAARRHSGKQLRGLLGVTSMRNLLGWLGTRLAQTTLNYL